MHRLTLHRVSGLEGSVRLPGDKSLSHRAVILGTLARGKTRVRNFLRSEDCLRTVEACRAIGSEIECRGARLTIRGAGSSSLREPDRVIDAGNSGTTMRLMAGLLAAQPFFCVLTGDDSLRRRPMRRGADPLRAMGAQIWGREGGDKAPLAIQGGPLTGMVHDLPVPSAQVKSALLLAGLRARGSTEVREPVKSRDHSERMLRDFGAVITETEAAVSIRGGQELTGALVDIPGDASSSAFLAVAALVTGRSRIVIRDVLLNPGRTGFIDILKAMGGTVEVEEKPCGGGEPRGDIHIRSSPLRGVNISGELVPRSIDEIPAVCVAASLADGRTVIRDAGELRVKESDRITVMAEELRRFGVAVEEYRDGLMISGGRRLRGARCRSHGDHRIAMALSVLGMAVSGRTVVEDTECIDTSFPGFWAVLNRLIRP